jgi:transposase
MMNSDYAVLVGLDWADQQHEVCWWDSRSGRIQDRSLKQSTEAISEWIWGLMSTHPGGGIAICLEQSRGAVINALMHYPMVDLYPVNPVTVAKYRSAFTPSGAKDDPGDAKILLELLQLHRAELKVWKADSEQTRLIGSLCEDRREMVNQRTGLCNTLRAKLKEYFPQALKLVSEDLFRELSCAFLMKWPSLEAVAAARTDTVRAFYYAQNSRNQQQMAQRLELIATAKPLCTDPAVVEASTMRVQALIRQIRVLNQTISKYDQRIREVFKTHPDHFIFESFPGAGNQLAPRLLAAFGTDRTRFESAQAAATYFGVSPVIVSSGKQRRVHWRWHCPKYIRQSLVEFAGCSIDYCPWAKLYYQEQIKREKGHHAAVRAVAFKWIRILFACWQQGCGYNEAKYMAAMQRHGSYIPEKLENAA